MLRAAKAGESRKRFLTMTERTPQVHRWVNDYPRGVLDRRCAGRVLQKPALEPGIKGVELLL